MSDSLASLRRQRNGAKDLQSVVRAMKALAASGIGQYERAVRSLTEYSHAIEMGLSVCLRHSKPIQRKRKTENSRTCAIIFGSDQGLVGQFNELLADFVRQRLSGLPEPPHLWTVGERMHDRLQGEGLLVRGFFPVPGSVKSISSLVGRILMESGADQEDGEMDELYLYYNRLQADVLFSQVDQRLLPLDETWRRRLAGLSWPTNQLPEAIGGTGRTLPALIREHLFVSMFRTCAESLASENASRLAAMQRAENNIEELLETLDGKLNQLRQSTIDEELFDVLAGFEAISKS